METKESAEQWQLIELQYNMLEGVINNNKNIKNIELNSFWKRIVGNKYGGYNIKYRQGLGINEITYTPTVEQAH